MIDIDKGRYWDRPLSLVSGCTPCSPGCDHCWSAAMTNRFCATHLLDGVGRFNGGIDLHPERLSIPLKRRKPTVYAIWNDLFHEAVPDAFIGRALSSAIGEFRHTFLVLTKRPQRMADLMGRFYADCDEKSLRRAINIWSGITVCNQQEADEKIPVFLQVPGKRFLSVEPMLGEINIKPHLRKLMYFCPRCEKEKYKDYCQKCGTFDNHPTNYIPGIDAVILGGETGPGARPMHPDWVRTVRDQCAAAGVPFFFKGWGAWVQSEYKSYSVFDKKMAGDFMATTCVSSTERKSVGETNYYPVPAGYDGEPIGIARMERKKNAGRLIDGRTHDDLPWIKLPLEEK